MVIYEWACEMEGLVTAAVAFCKVGVLLLVYGYVVLTRELPPSLCCFVGEPTFTSTSFGVTMAAFQ